MSVQTTRSWVFFGILYQQPQKKKLSLFVTVGIIGSAEALPILCVRCVRWEREWDRSDVTLVALKLAMNFAPFLGKKFAPWRRVLHFFLPKICTLVSPLLKGAEFTLSVAKNVALFETVRVHRFASVKWRDRGSKHETNDRISRCTVLLLIEKMNQINTKNYWK